MEFVIGMMVCVVAFGSMILLARYLDLKTFNGGVNKESGTPWHSFDTCSGGGTGYKDASGNYFWSMGWVNLEKHRVKND